MQTLGPKARAPKKKDPSRDEPRSALAVPRTRIMPPQKNGNPVRQMQPIRWGGAQFNGNY